MRVAEEAMVLADPSVTFAHRRRSIVLRAIAVSSGAIFLLALVAFISTFVANGMLARIDREARCIEIASAQLMRSAEMSRRVREIQLAGNRGEQLQEAFGLRSALVMWTQSHRDLLREGDQPMAGSELGKADRRFTDDVATVLSTVDAGRPISGKLRRVVDLDAQAFTVLEGMRLDDLREHQRRDQSALETEQRTYALAMAVIFVLLAIVLVGPALRRAATILEAIAREDEAEKRRATEEALAAIFAQSRTSVALLDGTGAILQGNAALATLLGSADLHVGGDDLTRYASAHDAIVPYLDGQSHRFDIELTARSGERRWGDASISVAARLPDGSRTFLMVLEDITARRALEERLQHEASYDPLTEIENRRAIRHRTAHAIANDRDGYLMLIDLDNFKLINDRSGHAVGDDMLCEVGRRLTATLGAAGTAGRIGGDEFVALVLGKTDEEIRALLARLITAIELPVTTPGKTVTVTASIGAARLGRASDADTEMAVDRVFRAADAALYRAKALGRNRFVIDEHEEWNESAIDLPSPADIREGLARDEFALVYQPIVDSRSHECIAIEALVRWRRGGSQWVSPDAFIPVAECSGTIVPLGTWIVQRACSDFAAMLAAGLPNTVDLHVNISALQIAQDDFTATISAALRAARVASHRLVLEVTESALVTYASDASSTLDDVRDLGVRWCIDDFGTGYSSLAYLHTLPIACIKIDRSFVSGASEGLANAPIVEAILQLGRTLGIAVVAEGVETPEQADALATQRCLALQGYLYAKPLDRDAVVADARERTSLASLTA